LRTELKTFLFRGWQVRHVFLTTNYTSDIVVTIPAECLNALQSAVQLTAPAPGPGGQMPAAAKADAEKAPGNPIVKVPKKWFAAADTKHGFVVVMLDHRTPEQFGFRAGSRRSEGACRRADQAGRCGGGEQSDQAELGALWNSTLNAAFRGPFNAITDRVGKALKRHFHPVTENH